MLLTFTAISHYEATGIRPVAPAHFEVTNLTGRVIARTANTSDANRAGAIALAKRRMGGCYEISAAGTRLRAIV